MDDGDPQQIETCPGEDNPELSSELMESIALEAVAAGAISGIALDDAPPGTVAIFAGEARPHFVIDPVDGRPIDEYCDGERLDVPARLGLFSRACEAVHFAHQHAMIHRDLQPGKILVAADRTVAIVDFGIARRIDPETRGERVLTPEYTSPEQINGEPVTTASDLYAMGVILYQLLTGRWPYRLGPRQGMADVLQAICEQAPERPSAAVFRVDKPGDPSATLESPPAPFPTPEEIAAARSNTPERLKRTLAGDLDAIVLMALGKEPEGRYHSAAEFADDLERHRKGLPVRARRDAPVDRAVKFARRYAAAVVAGLVLVLALVGGLVGTSMGLVHARRDRDRVEDDFRESRRTVNPLFLRTSEDRLLSQAGLRPLRQSLLLDLKRFYEDFLDRRGHDPALRLEVADAHAHLARIEGLTGSPTRSVSEYQRAIALWETLIKEQPGERQYEERLAGLLNDLGEVLLPLAGRLDEASTLFGRAQTSIERRVAADPGSVPLRHELASILMNVARIQRRRGQFDEAAQSVERVVEIESPMAAEDPRSLDPRIALAGAFSALGGLSLERPDLVRAMTAYQQAIEILDPLTREHPELADLSDELAADLGELGGLQRKTGLSGPALESLRRSLEIYERLGQSYPDVLTYQEGVGATSSALSDLRGHQGETAEALALARKAQTLFDRLAARHPEDTKFSLDLARTHTHIGRLLKRTGDPAGALRSFQRATDLLDSLPVLDPRGRYDLACDVALCVSLIGSKDPSKGAGDPAREPGKSDPLRRRIYGERAVAELRAANRGGFLDADMLQSNPDFDAIRLRPDFQALVKEVEGKPATAGK